MAFIGAHAIVQVSCTEILVKYVSLAPKVSGSIGLFRSEMNPDVRLPQSFVARPYEYQGGVVELADLLEISFSLGYTPGPFTNLIPSVEFIGLPPETLSIVVLNTHDSEETQPMTIRIRNARGACNECARCLQQVWMK